MYKYRKQKRAEHYIAVAPTVPKTKVAFPY